MSANQGKVLNDKINKCVTKVKSGSITNSSVTFDFTNDAANSMYLLVTSSNRLVMITRYTSTLGVNNPITDNVTSLSASSLKLTLKRDSGTTYYTLIKVA